MCTVVLGHEVHNSSLINITILSFAVFDRFDRWTNNHGIDPIIGSLGN